MVLLVKVKRVNSFSGEEAAKSWCLDGEPVGRVRTCYLEPAALRAAEQWIADRRADWERRFDRLAEYLAEHDNQQE